MSIKQDEQVFVKLQRPFRIKRSLKGLVHKPSLSKQTQHSLKLPPLPSHDAKTDTFVYDVLYECQRGSLSVGYSSKTLLQFDPNPWCDAEMRFTPMNTGNYQLPDPTWQWISKDWMIDMTDDVDEGGWQYSLKFHGADWHGNYKHFRSFVRRRRWIRLRHQSKKIKDVETKGSLEQLSSSYACQELTERLKECRLDREKMSVLSQAIESGQEDQVMEKMADYVNILDFEDTKCTLISKLLYKKQAQVTKEQLESMLDSLNFYGDREALLDHFNIQ